MFKRIALVGMSAAWLFGAGAALAFEETPAAPAPQSVAPLPGTNGLTVTDQKQVSPAPDKPAKSGKRKIPGLGFFNKLDFGLELLYGASPQDSQPDTAVPDLDSNDLSIRGTLKRRF